MDLESLKAAMEAALAASQAAASDKKLQAAYAEAKKAYDDAVAEAEKNKGNPDPDPEDLDEEKLDAKTKAHIAKLRKEAAGHRTKAKDLASQLGKSEEQKKAILKAAGVELETEDPETKLKALTAESQQLAFRTAILESAVENGIAKDQVEFFEFLVSKEAATLKENEEISDEKMVEIVAKVKAGGGGNKANSSVDGKGGGGKPPPKENTTEVTLEKFTRMTMAEKSKLYETNVDLYTSLSNEARRLKKLV